MAANTKVSEVTNDEIIDFLNEDPADPQVSNRLESIKPVARGYMRSYTGLNDEEIDEHAEFVHAYKLIIEDFYDNRSATVSNSAINKTLDTILSLNSKNNIG